jgi:hypothetical protein
VRGLVVVAHALSPIAFVLSLPTAGVSPLEGRFQAAMLTRVLMVFAPGDSATFAGVEQSREPSQALAGPLASKELEQVLAASDWAC